MTFESYLAQWQTLHGGAEPSWLVVRWLKLAFWLSTPFLRLTPNAITSLPILLLLLVVPGVATNSMWYLAGAISIFLVGLLDSFDGMVAVRTNRVTAWGAYLDAMADRLVDVLIGVMLIAAGANVLVISLAFTISLIHEYMRARAQGVGYLEVGLISVAEKPVRLILGFTGMLFAAISPFDSDMWTTLSGLAWIAVGLVGAGQVFWHFRKVLRSSAR
jgi:CDP-diacylglycerol--glycerol-3-phosphate 3-phosphatidyltransferase